MSDPLVQAIVGDAAVVIALLLIVLLSMFSQNDWDPDDPGIPE